jgi:hypothetical protein
MKFKFSLIELTKISSEYYDMKAFDKEGNVVYKATLSKIDASIVADKYNNVVLVKNK